MDKIRIELTTFEADILLNIIQNYTGGFQHSRKVLYNIVDKALMDSFNNDLNDYDGFVPHNLDIECNRE